MAPSDEIVQRIKELPKEKIDKIIQLLSGELEKSLPVNERDGPELYALLHKDVKRYLTELGHDEKREVRVFLLRLDKEKIERIDAMLEGYGEAQRLGRLVKVIWYGVVALLISTWGFVKWLPDGIDWIRTHIK